MQTFFEKAEDIKDSIFIAMLYVSAVLFLLIMGLRLNIPPTIDEVATLSNSAYWLGYDWSETLYALGGYYFKYGPALLYTPLMAICSSSYALYKSIMVLNSILYAFIPVFAYLILRGTFSADKLKSFAFALSTALLPSTALYTLYSRADSLLIFLPWPILYLFLRLVEQQQNKAVRWKISLNTGLLAVLTVYAYMCHMRGIVVVLTVIIAIILSHVIYKKPSVDYYIFIPALIILFFADKVLADYFYDGVYLKYGTGFSSAESYDFAYLKNIFTAGGMKAFIRMIIGTAYNVLVSTFGLVIPAVGALVYALFFKQGRGDKESPAILFAGVMFLGAFAMSCIYFFPYTYPYERVVEAGRSDWLVYGRYTACATGIETLIGMLCISDARPGGRRVGKSLTFFSLCLLLGLFVLTNLKLIDGVTAVSRNFIQLATFLKTSSYGSTTAVFENIYLALVLSGVLAIVIFCILVMHTGEGITGKKHTVLMPLVFCVFAFLITIVNYAKIRESRDAVLVEWTDEPTSYICSLPDEFTEYPVIVDTSAKDIKHYQFVCYNYVCGRASTTSGGAENCFIVSKKGTFRKSLNNKDYYVFEDFDYDNAVKDIVFVKGEELCKRLTEAGYSLAPYTGKLKK